MIGLGTNVVVRYLTQDDPVQTVAATRLMDSLTPHSPGFLSLAVVAELVWVLRGPYRFQKKDIQHVLETLLLSKELVVESSEIGSQALRRFAASRAEFADCLIERCGHAAECEYTATFERNASREAGMRMIE
jgi:predicted nucleic-acid-binding protein